MYKADKKYFRPLQALKGRVCYAQFLPIFQEKLP
jgi:hypothetical protein